MTILQVRMREAAKYETKQLRELLNEAADHIDTLEHRGSSRVAEVPVEGRFAHLDFPADWELEKKATGGPV